MILIATTPNDQTFIKRVRTVDDYTQCMTKYNLTNDELIVCDENKAIEYIDQINQLFVPCRQFIYSLDNAQKHFVYDLLSVSER